MDFIEQIIDYFLIGNAQIGYLYFQTNFFGLQTHCFAMKIGDVFCAINGEAFGGEGGLVGCNYWNGDFIIGMEPIDVLFGYASFERANAE